MHSSTGRRGISAVNSIGWNPSRPRRRMRGVSCSSTTGNSPARRAFRRATGRLCALDVRLMICGHTHNYEVASPEWAGGMTRITAGGRGSVPGTGWSLPSPLPPLAVVKPESEFTATLLNFREDGILMRGRCAQGLAGGIREMDEFIVR